MESKLPRTILHIGNIANNAYLNSKILNAAGCQSYVLCYDYYHVMGYPEWEDGEILRAPREQVHPDWDEAEFAKPFERPRWFVQGPLGLCLDYLDAELGGKKRKADAYWRLLHLYRVYMSKRVSLKLSTSIWGLAKHLKISDLNLLDKYCSIFLRRSLMRARDTLVSSPGWLFTRLTAIALIPIFVSQYPQLRKQVDNRSNAVFWHFKSFVKSRLSARMLAREQEIVSISNRVSDQFNSRFPLRSRLSADAVKQFVQSPAKLKSILSKFELIVGYGTGGFLPLFTDHRFVAYEHGTIRDLPWEDTVQGKLIALAFSVSEAIFMTNADSIPSARKLKSESRILYGVHGFDLDKVQAAVHEVTNQKRQATRAKSEIRQSDFWIFCPTRHDWEVKGNDRLIRGLHQACQLSKVNFRLTLIDWGRQAAESKELIQRLGLSEMVNWIQPMSKSELSSYMASCDLVADQFKIPCLGAIGLEVLASGRTVLLTALDQSLMELYYGARVPCLAASSENEIALQLIEYALADEEKRSQLKQNALNWMVRTHSRGAIINYFKALSAF